jgi:hypothetical protein
MSSSKVAKPKRAPVKTSPVYWVSRPPDVWEGEPPADPKSYYDVPAEIIGFCYAQAPTRWICGYKIKYSDGRIGYVDRQEIGDCLQSRSQIEAARARLAKFK